MKTLFTFFLLAVPLMAQAPFNATNVRLSAPPVQATTGSIARIFTLNPNGVGETITPTKNWDAIVATGTVDTADISGFSALGRALVDDVATDDMQNTLGATTVGKAFFTTANPSAITFVRVNANNSISYQTAADFRTDIGGTTIGQGYFTLTNPGAVTFPRQNANNSVTSRTAVELKTDLSLENVDNTSDANKPVSTATQTALNLKLNKAGTITNDNAGAGEIGEFISSLVPVGSAAALTTATPINVTSISLTAGDWDVEGNVNISWSSGTVTDGASGISSVTATLPTDGSEVPLGGVLTTTVKSGTTLPRKRFSLIGTTTVFLITSATFSGGTGVAYGAITARRVR